MMKKFICLTLAAVVFMAASPLFAGPARAAEEDDSAGGLATTAPEDMPANLTDTLNWITGVTLTGPDGAELGEDTPADAACLLAYTFAVPDEAVIRAGDTAVITLPKEVSAAGEAAFQILDEGGRAIAAASGDGQRITVTFSGVIPAGTSGSFALSARFNAANISGENPVQISFPLSLGNAQTIGVDFAGETEGSAPAVTAMDAAVMATTHTVSDGQTFDISTCADGDTVLVDAGATATITGSRNVQIQCGAGVNLTVDSVESNTSGKINAPALGFTGKGNTLTLVGTSTFTSGLRAAGVSIPGGAELTINGSGSLTANGGNNAAGIGGGEGGAMWNNTFGSLTIDSGTIKAVGGAEGDNYSAGGAGIGGGMMNTASGTITINGGTVRATGGSSSYNRGGAGIGGGAYSSNGKVVINGGTVRANGYGMAAGIGAGFRHSSESAIEITGGTVTATGGSSFVSSGAGIGGATYGAGGQVTISGGVVTATGGSAGGAGIGGGMTGGGGDVVISGGNVMAVGGGDGENIGRGANASQYTKAGTIKNTDGTDVYATNIRLEGSSAGGVKIQSITTDLAYSYGLNDVYSSADGNLFFYMPASTKTTEVTTPDEDYGGTAVTSSGTAQVFSFIVQGKDGREIELWTAGGYIQWRYTGDDDWMNLEPLSDISGTDGREIELRSNGTYIQWRYVGDDSWTNLEALSDITGADGTDGSEEIEIVEALEGAAISIAGISKTGTDGNVDIYTIAFTDGTSTTFTVTNGLGGASAAVNDRGELIFTLGDGTKINLGDTAQIADDLVAAGAADAHYDLQSDEKGAATLWVALAALALALLTFLSHIGLIRLPKKKKG